MTFLLLNKDKGQRIPETNRPTFRRSVSLNPISGRLLATPISGRGGLFRTALDISGSYRSIFKIQTAFVSPQHDSTF